MTKFRLKIYVWLYNGQSPSKNVLYTFRSLGYTTLLNLYTNIQIIDYRKEVVRPKKQFSK